MHGQLHFLVFNQREEFSAREFQLRQASGVHSVTDHVKESGIATSLSNLAGDAKVSGDVAHVEEGRHVDRR